MKKISIALLAVFAGALLFAGGAKESSMSGGEVTVYSSRHYDSDAMVFEAFTKKTGIKVNVVQDKDVSALIKKLELEGKDSPADVFITVGIGDLYQAKKKDLLQPFTSKVVKANIPAQFMDKDNFYTGLTYRARVLVYDPSKTDMKMLSTYEDLADPKWKGKILTRSSSSSYNKHLIAFMIAKHGREEALKWTKGLVANFAREPKGNDRDQAKTILSGVGEVGIMNSYYMGKMAVSDDPVQKEVAQKLKLFFPNQGQGGVHANLSGAGITKYAKNKANAQKLIEFLTGADAQKVFTEQNFEFPANPKTEMPELLKSWGKIEISAIDFDKIGENLEEAVVVAGEANFN
ncbi:MAG: Fe(3+) ABC transporter substrate-binding protein [Deltaproteobacteria bacterium]|nr:MAG: Fe(3+) ABC transporter substrate-binding protein [Deltaproteobacteria bacterium]